MATHKTFFCTSTSLRTVRIMAQRLAKKTRDPAKVSMVISTEKLSCLYSLYLFAMQTVIDDNKE